MATQLQLRRGTTAENDQFIGAAGELTVDTTENLLRIHDGSTQGGSIAGKTYTAGTGITLTNDEFSIGQSVETTDNVTFNNITANGDLTVNGALSIPSNTIGTDELDVDSTGSAGEALLSDGDGTFSFGPAGATITDDTSTNSSFYPALTDSTSGSFTAATVSSTKLYFNPSSGTLNATTFNSLSDERVKKNVQTLDDALNKTLSLRGVSFTFKDTEKDSIGLIAQELENIVPEVVETGSDGYKSVSYGNLVGLLIEAIRDQQSQIDDLREQLEN